MKRVSQNYSQYVNRRHERYGTLWQGRYRSCLVADERYFLTCHRYIELNPTRAGMTLHPEDYEWSSYRANAFGAASPLVKPHSIYIDLALLKDEREDCYRRLFDEAMSDEITSDIRRATNGNLAIGSRPSLDGLSVELGRDVTRQAPGRKQQ
jgi:putative transposase